MDKQWMPRERWDALVRGEGCDLCLLVTENPEVNDYGITVAEWETSLFRLMFNQYVPGYALVVSKQHVREPYELPQSQQTQFFAELMRAGAALEKVYQPIKMNFQLLGNLTPHVHAHIIPRYYGDDAPGGPLDPWKENRRAMPDALWEKVNALRAVL